MWSDLFSQYQNRFVFGERHIGLEKEFPVVRKDDYKAFDVRSIFPDLISMGGEPEYDPFYQNEILGVKVNGVTVTTDAGWGTLELPSIPATNLMEAENAFNYWMDLLKSLIEPKGGIILGYGIQPKQLLGSGLWIKKRRHQVVCRNFGCIHDKNITITSSDQVHLSVNADELVRVNSMMNWLSGIIIALFANSPIWQNEIDGVRLAVREHMWWFAPHNRYGIFSRPAKSIRQLFDHIISMQHLVSQNCQDYVLPGMSFKEWIETKAGPDRFWEELPALEGTLWTCARPRAIYGTVEIRPACTQPRESALALPAFCLGIVENLKAAETLVAELGCDYHDAAEIREIAMARGLKASFSNSQGTYVMQEVCRRFLKVAEQGLKNRCFGEEVYLNQLWKRVETGRTLAEDIIDLYKEGGLPALVERVRY